ncbi:MAG TPA: FAD-binding protein, partial [Terriglobales bacterium]|nr:FAD-binding protein [Terriglobales bacterium]
MSLERTPEAEIERLRQRLSARPAGWRDAGSRIDASALERELRAAVTGEVRFDAGSKAMYAVDASNYRQVPIGVVIPKSTDDVVRTIALCRQFGAPVLSRGGGTSLSGQCCNVAVVIDWSKYMNRI